MYNTLKLSTSYWSKLCHMHVLIKHSCWLNVQRLFGKEACAPFLNSKFYRRPTNKDWTKKDRTRESGGS